MSEVKPNLRRKRKDAHRNLERVLQAAHELFAEHGADVTMEAVARRAGVGVATIYRRFESKEELFAAVSDAACTTAHDHACNATAAATDIPGKLRALFTAHYRLLDHQAALLELRPDPQSDARCNAAFDHQALYTTLHALVRDLIAAGQVQGIFRAGDPALLAVFCVELLTPRAFQHLRRGAADSLDAVAAEACAFVLAGLRV